MPLAQTGGLCSGVLSIDTGYNSCVLADPRRSLLRVGARIQRKCLARLELETRNERQVGVRNSSMVSRVKARTNSLSVLIRWVESPGLSGREPPVDPLCTRVPAHGPGRHGVLHRRPIAEPLPQTLPGKHAQFKLGHVEPGAVLEGVCGSPACRSGTLSQPGKRSVEGSGRVSVDLIHDQHNPRGVGVMNIDQALDTVGKINARPLVADRHVPPASQRLDQEQADHATPHVFRVVAGRMTGYRRQWGTHLTEQEAAGLIQADDRSGRITGASVDI